MSCTSTVPLSLQAEQQTWIHSFVNSFKNPKSNFGTGLIAAKQQ
jgi:hypothetical protein